MLDLLKERKEALEARGKKGFTLMEMLIVIAIIAVLVAIAIPVLSGQLENSREATDAANIRSAYAEVATHALNSPKEDYPATVTKQQQQEGWQNASITDIAGVAPSYINSNTATEVKYTASTGKITIDSKEAKTSFGSAASASSGSSSPTS